MATDFVDLAAPDAAQPPQGPAAPHDLALPELHDLVCGDEPPPLLSPSPPVFEYEEPGEDDLKALYAEAVTATWTAVRDAEASHERELAETGARLREEQERLYQIVMLALPGAVRAAASHGQRVATLLRFGGGDKLGEFCYLYMLKGPHNPEHRAEMRAMGARPLLNRLRAKLQAAGFGVHHAWQRATNDNALSVTW